MIPRNLGPVARERFEKFPVLTITGPRQSGKTTLCRSAFSELPYANLELPPVREFALQDPAGFLAQFKTAAVLDEVQRAPELLPFIQDRVDQSGKPGQFVLTGSQHFGLLGSVSQSLAGRTAVLHLLPLSLDEIHRFSDSPQSLWGNIYTGGFPGIHDQRIPAGEWMASYTATYLERDVRQVQNVGDLNTFHMFLRLCAGRTGQILNFSALAADCGVSHNTARAWLTVLETSFVVFRVPPFHVNFGKRLTKSPKLFFYDTGLVCSLLGIRTPEDLCFHPLRGALFESWVVSEIAKARVHRGLAADLSFFRDHKGEEVDLLVGSGMRVAAVEIKSAETLREEALTGLERFATLSSRFSEKLGRLDRILIYGGEKRQDRTRETVLPWTSVSEFDWFGY